MVVDTNGKLFVVRSDVGHGVIVNGYRALRLARRTLSSSNAVQASSEDRSRAAADCQKFP